MLTGVVSGVAVHSPLSSIYFTSPSIRWILVRSTTDVSSWFSSVPQIPRETVPLSLNVFPTRKPTIA